MIKYRVDYVALLQDVGYREDSPDHRQAGSYSLDSFEEAAAECLAADARDISRRDSADGEENSHADERKIVYQLFYRVAYRIDLLERKRHRNYK